MRITLVYPYFLLDRLHVENISPLPMGLHYLAALLKEHGHQVSLHNWHDAYNYPQRVREILASENPDILGISIFHGNRWGGLDVAELAKELLPGVKVVFGGVGATFLWELLLRHFRQVDYVVLGEGEETFLELISHLKQGIPDSPAEIAGLAYNSPVGPVCNADRPLLKDLDALPNPARHFTYQHLSLTRGCPGSCRFCGSPRLWHRKVRAHSASYFVEQMAMQKERGVQFFYVSDDTFTVNKQRAMEVCRRLTDLDLGVQWAAISRVNAVDPELLAAMRRAGCVQISYGVESGSPTIRRRLGKIQSNETIIQAFSETTRYGILPRAYFIYGCPGESWETVEETWTLIREIKPLICLFYVLSLFPGTALYEEFKRRSGLDDDIWLERNEDIFYFETDPDMDQETVAGYGRELKRRYFQHLPRFAEEIVLVDEPEFHPLHADFLSRLGLTFIAGDYATNESVPDKEASAELLFDRALKYADNGRAFWGKAMLLEKKGGYMQAVDYLEQALNLLPGQAQLRLSLAHCLAAVGRKDDALEVLRPLEDTPQGQSMALQIRKGC